MLSIEVMRAHDALPHAMGLMYQRLQTTGVHGCPRRPESIREDSRAVPAEPWLALESSRPTRDPVSSMEPAEARNVVLLDTREATVGVSHRTGGRSC